MSGSVSQQGAPGPEAAYRGAQHDLVIRGTGALSVIGALAVLALLPFYPPTHHIGWLGWALAIPLSVLSIGLGGLNLTLKLRPGMETIYASSYTGIAQLAFLQWLAGGGRAPYIELLLLPTLGAGTSQPVRRAGLVALASLAGALSQLLYGPIDVGVTLVEFSTVAVMTVMTAAVLSSTRTHRARLKDANDQATVLAHLDPLTQLPNRRAFDEAFLRAVDGCRQGGAFSLILCDVDAFKEINDTFGHEAGDELLRAIGEVISEAVRKPDAAFRWAGDEFAVILRDSDEAGAGLVAHRIRQAVASQCQRPDGIPVTIGTGIAQLHPHMRPKEVFMAADRSLFSQKSERLTVTAAVRAA